MLKGAGIKLHLKPGVSAHILEKHSVSWVDLCLMPTLMQVFSNISTELPENLLLGYSEIQFWWITHAPLFLKYKVVIPNQCHHSFSILKLCLLFNFPILTIKDKNSLPIQAIICRLKIICKIIFLCYPMCLNLLNV